MGFFIADLLVFVQDDGGRIDTISQPCVGHKIIIKYMPQMPTAMSAKHFDTLHTVR